MISRRRFLQSSTLVSMSPLIPMFLPRSARAVSPSRDDRILVVIQLGGGNDGLNTLIPFADEEYARHRNVLRIADDQIIKLNDSVGLHPSMKPCADLFEAGQLSIVQGVGYPNPSRSHFESMDIWQSARTNTEDRTGHGWLGRAIDAGHQDASSVPDAVFVGDSAIPVAIRGRRANAISLNSEDELRLFASVGQSPDSAGRGDLNEFIQQTVDASYLAAQRFAQSAPAADGSRYPSSNLGRKLQLLSQILKLGGGTRVFYASQSGYDTHSDQLGLHSRLLRTFSSALSTFLKDMEESNLADRVMVLAFSEFGRRVGENGSAGTDHGTAGPVFIAGKTIEGGLLGKYPSLRDLDSEGDLKMTVDFRRVYASVLSNWLAVQPASILDGDYEPLHLCSS